MSVEAYSVAFEKANYHAPITRRADSVGVYEARENEIRDNMVRYVGEYRLGAKFDEFHYRIEEDSETGERYFASKKAGPIRNIYRNAISDRESKGASVRREVAECLGFERLEKELLDAPDGTMAIWVSPPGPKSEGYGDYSFSFLAQVIDGDDGRNVRMIPYRNEFSLEEHNSYLSKLTNQDVSFTKDTQFLSTPFILEQNESMQTPDGILVAIGEEEKFDDSWRGEVEGVLRPYIDWFMHLVRENASDEELIIARNVIENLAIAYKEDKEGLVLEIKKDEEITIGKSSRPGGNFVNQWSDVPSIVLGSCPIPTPELNSGAATPMEFQSISSSLDKDNYGKRTFNCPACKKENKRPYNRLLAKCQHCNSTEVTC